MLVQRCLGGLLAFLALGLVGCQGARWVVPLSLEPAGLVLPEDPRLLSTHEAAVRGISAMLAREFGMPVPEQMTVYVYGSRRAFEEGSVRDARLSPARAAELSGYAIGVGRPRQLLFYDVASERGREWLRLVAHELTHVCQIELAGVERGPAQWLKEGMAEWIAFSVLERLGLDSVARRRESARGSVRHSVSLAAARPDLEALGSVAGFTARHRSDGAVLTYQVGFLMVDHLIDRNGFARLFDYFREFTLSGDGERIFERVFGQTPEAFEREVLEGLAPRGK
jgi:hypothetical protein